MNKYHLRGMVIMIASLIHINLAGSTVKVPFYSDETMDLLPADPEIEEAFERAFYFQCNLLITQVEEVHNFKNYYTSLLLQKIKRGAYHSAWLDEIAFFMLTQIMRSAHNFISILLEPLITDIYDNPNCADEFRDIMDNCFRRVIAEVFFDIVSGAIDQSCLKTPEIKDFIIAIDRMGFNNFDLISSHNLHPDLRPIYTDIVNKLQYSLKNHYFQTSILQEHHA